jgi:predicted transcriptional regulator
MLAVEVKQKKMPKRHHLQIEYDFLRVCRTGKCLTHIARATGTNTNTVYPTIERLINAGLLTAQQRRTSTRKSLKFYVTTEKGIEFVRLFERLEAMSKGVNGNVRFGSETCSPLCVRGRSSK